MKGQSRSLIVGGEFISEIYIFEILISKYVRKKQRETGSIN